MSSPSSLLPDALDDALCTRPTLVSLRGAYGLWGSVCGASMMARGRAVLAAGGSDEGEDGGRQTG